MSSAMAGGATAAPSPAPRCHPLAFKSLKMHLIDDSESCLSNQKSSKKINNARHPQPLPFLFPRKAVLVAIPQPFVSSQTLVQLICLRVTFAIMLRKMG
jgi:hypothetical protein